MWDSTKISASVPLVYSLTYRIISVQENTIISYYVMIQVKRALRFRYSGIYSWSNEDSMSWVFNQGYKDRRYCNWELFEKTAFRDRRGP